MKSYRYHSYSVVVGIIVINVIVYLLTDTVHFPLPSWVIKKILSSKNDLLIYSVNTYGLSITLFSLFPMMIKESGWIWQFVTYMFMHGSMWHLFFNMYALYLFGKPLEERWGGKQFFFFYMFTGVGAGVVTYFWNLFKNPYIPTVGASGAIFGVILAFGLEFPETILLLFFFIPVKARYAAFIFGGIELVMLLTGAMQRIGHFTHIAGLLFGYIYYLIFIRSGIGWIKRIKLKIGSHAGNNSKDAKSLSYEGRPGKFEIKRRKRYFSEADVIARKIAYNETLTKFEEKLLAFLREQYEQSSGLCEPSEFDAQSKLCLYCENYYACLYRYIALRSRYLME